MRFLNSFRGRLLLTLAVLLIATIGFQYFLNLRTQGENIEIREEQTRALVAGISLGFQSIPAEKMRVKDFFDEADQTYFDEATKQRIRDIVIVNSQWLVTDSLNPDYLPVQEDVDRDGDGKDDITYRRLADLADLPPLMEGARLGADLANFPNQKTEANKDRPDESHAIPLDTSDGRYYVIVVLRNDKADAWWRAARPLIFTVGVLLVSSLITFLLVWRFTRPIANLSDAARKVAAGDLDVRVPDADRSDEMGQLSQRFNEMVAELEKNRELEAQLQQAEKSAVVGRLGSAIAHEIRNPLNYINLTLDHLRSKYAPADEEKRATFEKLTFQLKGEVARINQQISDFLNYSRPANPTLKAVLARSVIEDSLRIAETEAEDKHVRISVVEHENSAPILADPEYLRSVFNNLFINAIQAMEGQGGGQLTIKIAPDEADPAFVMFEVTDTGVGIPEENLPKIFEPYFSSKETGTGLGLAIVQKIVAVHQGTIDVESKLGEGTKFVIRLPRA
jgi:signal transduction histidine kinase